MSKLDTHPTIRDPIPSLVREAWIEWEQKQTQPRPSWLVPYDQIDEQTKKRIAESVNAYLVMVFYGL